ncbi:MAG TPA: peptide-methionine (S)-S-oxide reductase MsrA [Candidatus Angelobacter sp.]|nr:peptide-methionine (S)-S-oxide reductase MsrA [Candidatus Angelobacter sp.]
MYRLTAAVAVVVVLLGIVACNTNTVNASGAIPDPALDEPKAKSQGQETAVLAGGCFWGVQAVFQHLKGVKKATSGYAGGSADTAQYEVVSTGTTGHAESVKVVYDPSQISYGQILKVYFSVAHDPTELNRQGPDEGTQYRSAIFFATDDQKRIAQAYISQLNQAKVFHGQIVTVVAPLKAFYPAEDYHQDYLALHPNNPYIVYNDLPKLDRLREQFPDMYVGKK